jgi:hypothetical protein
VSSCKLAFLKTVQNELKTAKQQLRDNLNIQQSLLVQIFQKRHKSQPTFDPKYKNYRIGTTLVKEDELLEGEGIVCRDKEMTIILGVGYFERGILLYGYDNFRNMNLFGRFFPNMRDRIIPELSWILKQIIYNIWASFFVHVIVSPPENLDMFGRRIYFDLANCDGNMDDKLSIGEWYRVQLRHQEIKKVFGKSELDNLICDYMLIETDESIKQTDGF